MRHKHGILALAVVAALGASLVSAPADAGHKHKHGPKHGHKPKRHHSAHRSHVGHSPYVVHPRHGRVGIGHPGHRQFVVPRHIHRGARRTYRPYYHDRIYYGPHRHSHAVYYFPVHTRSGAIWRPHYYCNGNLFGRRVIPHRADRPRRWTVRR